MTNNVIIAGYLVETDSISRDEDGYGWVTTIDVVNIDRDLERHIRDRKRKGQTVPLYIAPRMTEHVQCSIVGHSYGCGRSITTIEAYNYGEALAARMNLLKLKDISHAD